MSEDIQVIIARFDEKLDALAERVHGLEKDRTANMETQKAIAVLSSQFTQLINKVDALNAKVDELEKKPADRWDSLVKTVVAAIAGIIVGWFLNGGVM